jgi:hypothetical protein
MSVLSKYELKPPLEGDLPDKVYLLQDNGEFITTDVVACKQEHDKWNLKPYNEGLMPFYEHLCKIGNLYIRGSGLSIYLTHKDPIKNSFKFSSLFLISIYD